jgi:hypothetical protein
MPDVEVTGTTGAAPLTTLLQLKEATKTLRTGTDAQVDALYPRVLKTLSWFYCILYSIQCSRYFSSITRT